MSPKLHSQLEGFIIFYQWKNISDVAKGLALSRTQSDSAPKIILFLLQQHNTENDDSVEKYHFLGTLLEKAMAPHS